MILDVNVITSGWVISSVIVSFSVVLVALIFGIISVRQLTQVRKDEKRESGLKDIINWTTKVLEVNREPATAAQVFLTGKPGTGLSKYAQAVVQRQAINMLSWQGVYILALAKQMNAPELRDTIEKLRRLIGQHIRVLDLANDGKMKHTAAVGKHRDRMDVSARRIISLAVDLLQLT